MKVNYLVAEIGSTTTEVTAINITENDVQVIDQGAHPTTVLDGDVTIGLRGAISDIEKRIGEKIEWERMLSTSSAAGGLRITVHGLVEDMTVKAAREAALGAGGIIKMVTAGRLRKSDLKKIHEINPNLIMIAGGTDYGERDTALYNSEIIAEENFNIPIVYCGNIANVDEVKDIFEGQELYIVDNVYPRVDELNVEPARKVIQNAFENNIVKAPGMSKIKDMVNGAIMTTPGAVMEATKLLYEQIGDLVVFDVGGATTDVHSVTDGDVEILNILVSPEPKAKRTVEGDLGVFVNSKNIIEILNDHEIKNFEKDEIHKYIKSIPESDREKEASSLLTEKAVKTALNRHVGYIKRAFGANKKFIAYGKDLSKVKYIVGTGGALTKLPRGREILENIKNTSKEEVSMLPKGEANVLLDNMYIMACAGVLGRENREAATILLKKSLEI